MAGWSPFNIFTFLWRTITLLFLWSYDFVLSNIVLLSSVPIYLRISVYKELLRFSKTPVCNRLKPIHPYFVLRHPHRHPSPGNKRTPGSTSEGTTHKLRPRPSPSNNPLFHLPHTPQHFSSSSNLCHIVLSPSITPRRPGTPLASSFPLLALSFSAFPQVLTMTVLVISDLSHGCSKCAGGCKITFFRC